SLPAPASSSSTTSSARRSRTSPANSSGGRSSRSRATPAGRCARPPGSLRNPPALPVRSIPVFAFLDTTLLFKSCLHRASNTPAAVAREMGQNAVDELGEAVGDLIDRPADCNREREGCQLDVFEDRSDRF